MRDIYQQSEETIIWLGGGKRDIERLMRRFRDFGTKVVDAGFFRLGDHGTAQQMTQLELERLGNKIGAICHEDLCRNGTLSGKVLLAWKALSWLPWFSRVWVSQEIWAARNYAFAYGAEIVDGEVFNAAFALLIFCLKTETSNFDNSEPGDRQTEVSNILCLRFTSPHRGTLDASDPRDRIFAFLGISSDRQNLNIRIDYSLDQATVFATATRRMLLTGHLEILGYHRPGLSASGGLSIWSPNWTEPLPPLWASTAEDGLFHASGNHKLQIGSSYSQDHASTGLLQFEWYLVGTLKNLCNPAITKKAKKDDTIVAGLNRMFRILQAVEILTLAGSRYSMQEQQEGKWRIPIGDREVHSGNIELATANSESEYISFRRACMSKKRADLMQYGYKVTSYRAMLWQFIEHSALITDNQYVGLCPNYAVEGDEVWILKGAHVPHILRRRDRAGKYSFIGQAFVYGIMQGEFFETSEPRESQLLTLE
ncbi:hypothetical protein GGR57DRAFT_515434 [Xylariaceae sp. FL1272]|nr:hypothetical protein GGR57DRAFT_515434 [Xylariaceae sp. FL1272]